MIESIANNFEIIADAVYEKGIEKGKENEHSKFWDTYQDYGNRTSYANGFQGNMGWTKDNFYPKYDIKPVGNAIQLLYAWEYADKHTMDLSARLKECGVVLDTSQATNLTHAFAYVRFATIPPIDLTGLTANASLLFGDSRTIKTIEKIIMAETTPIATTWFRNDIALENLTIEGTIGQSNFNVKDCKKLTKASLLSILKALSLNITATTTITFSTAHQTTIETDPDCKPYYDAAKAAGWSIVYA